MPGNAQSAWTESRIQKLRELHAAGYSMRKMAEELHAFDGAELSRNAVIGKCRRLGLEERGKTYGKTIAKRSRRPRQRQAKIKRAACVNRSASIISLFDRASAQQAPPLHLTVYELTNSTCKWEVSKQDDAAKFTFCGHATAGGTPYCTFHASIAYLPPTNRREKVKAVA